MNLGSIPCGRKKNFFFSTTIRLALVFIHIQRAIPVELKRPGSEADSSPACGGEKVHVMHNISLIFS